MYTLNFINGNLCYFSSCFDVSHFSDIFAYELDIALVLKGRQEFEAHYKPIF